MTSNKGDKPPHPTVAANEGVPAATTETEAHPEQSKDETGCDCKPKVVMRPELLRAAHHADCQRLRDLLDRSDRRPQAAATSCQDDDVVVEVYRSSPLTSTAGAGTTVKAKATSTSLLEGTTFQGDSALHLVAIGGDDANFLESASLIYGKAMNDGNNLLEATNNNGDTSLHCAARASSVKMVSHLLKLAAGDDDGAGDRQRQVELLRKENRQHETVLHEAVRLGNKDLIDKLMTEDPELARHPSNGTSPLYLAVILLKDLDVAKQLHDYDEKLSYSGPKGQNVLHAAVLRTKEATKMLLDWNNDLAGEGDRYGQTPLHFAVSVEDTKIPYYYKLLLFVLQYIDRSPICIDRLLYPRKTNGDSLTDMLVGAEESSAYQPDDKGSFPIHVATVADKLGVINILLNKSLKCASLRNAKGRTFLHVAVEESRYRIVRFVCRRKPLVDMIINMQDNDGNTALHIAVQAGDLRVLLCLLAKPEVKIDCLNNEGLTPLDTSLRLKPKGLHHESNPRIWITRSLKLSNAKLGNPRHDDGEEKCICKKVREKGDSKSEEDKDDDDEQEDSKTLRESTQVMGVCSALIATVAFAAAFTLPGGYRADDHTNGGTPAFVGSYAFGAFVLAITFAFIFSLLATLSLVYSGSPKVDYGVRLTHLNLANSLVWLSIRCLLAAFALGLYVVLAPVAHKTALVICLMCSAGLLYGHEPVRTDILLAANLQGRLGFKVWWLLGRRILGDFWHPFWPFLIIFGWPAYLKWRHQQ